MNLLLGVYRLHPLCSPLTGSVYNRIYNVAGIGTLSPPPSAAHAPPQIDSTALDATTTVDADTPSNLNVSLGHNLTTTRAEL